MKIYDISVTISPDLPVFPGDPPVRIDPVTRLDLQKGIQKGDRYTKRGQIYFRLCQW